MEIFSFEFTYYGHRISQSIDIPDVISQLDPAENFDTILKIIKKSDKKAKIEPFQKAVLKAELTKLFEQLGV